jgi:hypothetical protein
LLHYPKSSEVGLVRDRLHQQWTTGDRLGPVTEVSQTDGEAPPIEPEQPPLSFAEVGPNREVWEYGARSETLRAARGQCCADLPMPESCAIPAVKRIY